VERPVPPAIGFKRTLFVPGVIFAALEAAIVLAPLVPLFQPTLEQRGVVLAAAPPILAGALVLWYAALGTWLLPVQRLLTARRKGTAPPEGAEEAARRALGALPLRSFALRTALWLVVAVALAMLLATYSGWGHDRVAALVSVMALHAAITGVLRAAWTSRLVARVRLSLFASQAPLRDLHDRFFRRLLLVALMVGAGASAALSAFIYFFLPIRPEQFLALETWLTPSIAAATIFWWIYARRARRPIDAYLAWQLEGRAADTSAGGVDPRAIAAYRGAQSMPYRLAGARLFAWVLAAALCAVVARRVLDVDFDNAVLFFAAALVIFVGAALYEAIWHRDTIRPLLVHISVMHRLPVGEVRAALSLRTKLLISFGGLVLFACGLSLFWGFIQYKTLATSYLARQARLTQDWVASEVQGRAGQQNRPPTPALVDEVLRHAAASSPDGAIFYYLAPGASRPVGVSGAPEGAPRLPWYAAVPMRAARRGDLAVGVIGLSGSFFRLEVTWNGVKTDLGTLAVLHPSYRGRGPGIQRPLLELLVFFFVLFGVSAGIVVLTVSEFVNPIRKLEQRADEMARGELSRSVTSGGEGDEVGRLTFALEEMRRALREKLRSTEEVNLDLEREVQRRTADLAKKNKELADALEKLTRAQSQLVRSEKMASIGQLVAGIAHEINNPVNAIANTVGPLREVIEDVKRGGPEAAQAAPEIDDMMRVIQNGARRTQSIVQALHNYSRTDEERIVELDVNRGLDDSLELLRHHLKGHISVDRRYGEVGRIKGHAGQLNQVFMNLLTNAAQAVAGRDGAEIALATRRHDGTVIIEVADNGPGIPPEILPKIFDPFFTTKEVGQGSGLGLSIVHGIVERHGGTIEVDSRVGQGTTFTVTLPANRA
jgi:signal transduction histidine kinase